MRASILPVLLFAHGLGAQNAVTVQLQSYATGLSNVVDIAHAGDERLFAVLQPGTIRIVDEGGDVLATPFLDISASVNYGGERGLLGLAFDPDYATNGFFYVNYIHGSGNGSTRISRFSVSTEDPNRADPLSEHVIYSWPQPFGNHKGGDLDFGPDGFLYVPLGDGGSAGDPDGHAQDLSDPLGDIIRLDVSDPDTTYTVPATNPWVGVSGDTLPEIWASGLRNPFRFGFDALTGDIWIGDVGQSAFEEVDFWPAGDNSGPNFGWRCYEGNAPFNTAGCEPQEAYVAPVSVHVWGEQSWCSVMGGRVYRGSDFARLYGRYIYTDYCGGQFYSLQPDGQGDWVKEQLRATAQSGFTCIAENNALELFAANKNNGTIYRIIDPCPMAAPVVTQDDGTLTSTVADDYAWYVNGELIPGATTQSIFVTTSGSYHVVGGFQNGCELESAPITVISTGLPDGRLPMFSVMPVPARDAVVLSGLPSTAVSVGIVDISGRSIASHPLNGTGSITIDVADLANANYIVRLVDTMGNTVQQRLMQVQH